MSSQSLHLISFSGALKPLDSASIEERHASHKKRKPKQLIVYDGYLIYAL